MPCHTAAFRHCSVFCYKSEMTMKQLLAIQTQWRALDCFPPRWTWFSDYDACRSVSIVIKVTGLDCEYFQMFQILPNVAGQHCPKSLSILMPLFLIISTIAVSRSENPTYPTHNWVWRLCSIYCTVMCSSVRCPCRIHIL